jgi:aminotransferase
MINVFQPAVGPEELAAVRRVLDSRWLGRGNECESFEAEFAQHIKADKVLLFNSCTSALYVGLKAIGIGPGAEVIIPTIHFVAAMNAVIELGATPVLADVDRHTLNITPSEIERLTTNKTAAVILLHYGGHPCDVYAIQSACRGPIAIVEDAAGAVASSYRSRPCGALGDMGVWSFDAMKTMTMGDGGALWLKDAKRFDRAKSLRYLGLEQASGVDALKSGKSRWWEYSVTEPSGRFISNDILAAIGRAQLTKLPQFVKRRWQIWQTYQRELRNLPIRLPPNPLPFCESTYYLYWIQAENRDDLAAHLAEADIYTTFRYYPLHRAFGISGDFPNADYVAETTLNLPIHPSLTDDDVGYVCQSVRSYFRGGG